MDCLPGESKMNKNMDRNAAAFRMSASGSAANIRLLVLDIDGTIVGESNRVPESVIQAINLAQRRGVTVAIATGRSYRSSLEAYDSIGSTLPLICHEGALIREPNTRFVHRHWRLEVRIVKQMLDYLDRSSEGSRVSFYCFIEDDLYVWNLNGNALEHPDGSIMKPIVVNDLRQLLNQAPTKVMVLSDDYQVIARLRSQLRNTYSRVQVTQTTSVTVLEALHPAANKGLAVSWMAEKVMALEARNVLAVGDALNDIEMLEYAGIGVAMGNAPPEVKAIADWVAPPIEEDGVARTIEKWILNDGPGPAPIP